MYAPRMGARKIASGKPKRTLWLPSSDPSGVEGIATTQRPQKIKEETHLMLLVLLFLSLLAPPHSDSIKTGEELIQAMRSRYAGKWYKTATFVQKTTNYQPDGTSKAETWYEAMALPGRLRIDFDPIKDGNGLLFVDDTLNVFKDGKLDKSQPLIHPLMVLGFDVYALPVKDTLDKLKELKFDLSILREDTWQGRPVYVVGAKAGDTHSPQFWIDKEHLYFVRMLKPAGKDGSLTQEVQFNKYQRLGGGWMSPEVVFSVNDRRVTLEEYSDIHGDVKLNDELFKPETWTTEHHWR